MKPLFLAFATDLPVSNSVAFAWHRRPGAFERLSPPWQSVRVLRRTGTIGDGDQITLVVKAAGIPMTWELRHRDFQPDVQFCDQQVRGPFGSWRHTHRFTPLDGANCRLHDQIEFAPPLGPLGRWFARPMVINPLRQLFAWRRRVLVDDLQLHEQLTPGRRLRVALTGATGMVGRQLAALLTTGGHEVLRVSRRRTTEPDSVGWDPQRGIDDPARLEALDAVIHLAGENVASRWTKRQRAAIRDSRVIGTQRLVEQLKALRQPPRALVCASAVGYYGARGSEPLDESAEPGAGFLAEVCQEWEAATHPATQVGVRVVNARLGVVLHPAGGALARMLPPFCLGLGGPLGNGRQHLPWITLNDAISALYFAAVCSELSGPVNLVAPQPTTNAQFTRALGRALKRPAILPAPAFALRLALGQMAQEMLLTGANVQPTKLLAAGYRFRDPQLQPALQALLGRLTLADTAMPLTDDQTLAEGAG